MEESLEKALEAGYRLIDTSYEDGNEISIGVVLQRWIEEEKLQRDQLFVTAKVILKVVLNVFIHIQNSYILKMLFSFHEF